MKDIIDEIVLENNLKEKMHKEIEAAKKQNNKKKAEKNFDKLQENELFSKNCYWKVFNRRNNTTSIINGIQADGYIGTQENVRYEITTHKTDCFLAGHLYIEFHSFN